MTSRTLPGIDEESLRLQAQAQFAKLEASHTARAPGRPAVEQLFQPSFPIAD
jgi:hypothetical protein